MKVNYQYASPSVCIQEGSQTILGLSPELSREEEVSFLGRLKQPLVFRDAMLMLRQIVISDMRQGKKERVEFFAWLNDEIEARILQHEKYTPHIRAGIENKMAQTIEELEQKQQEIVKLTELRDMLKEQADQCDSWSEYYKLEREFWKFLKGRDMDLWFVLDPVITVHKDQISFEAFSIDESTYGCLSVAMEEFELLQEPKLGTTNIDFSATLAKEMERFRTYTDVTLSVNPNGFTIDSEVMPEHVEKKIDLPETWIKGFNQVSSAACLDGICLTLAPVDVYDICCFLRRYKEKKSPRYMLWVLEPEKQVTIIFEPFGIKLTLRAIYKGKKKREEKIWGRRRWLVMEQLIPLSNFFEVHLLGFGMPQFLVANMGTMKMTIGFSSWSSNDWVKGTAFNIMAGFIGDGNYNSVYQLLKQERNLSIEQIFKSMNQNHTITKAGIGMLLKRGEGYYDLVHNTIRFRRLCKEPIPKELYEITEIELQVQTHLKEGMDAFTAEMTEKKEVIFTHSFLMPNAKYQDWRYYNTPDFRKEYDNTKTEITIDEDGQIVKVYCNCKEFKQGSKNISSPCSHILALYLISIKFLKLTLQVNRQYKINDIMEMLL